MTIVRLPPAVKGSLDKVNEKLPTFRQLTMVDGINKIIADMVAKKNARNVVINISLGISEDLSQGLHPRTTIFFLYMKPSNKLLKQVL